MKLHYGLLAVVVVLLLAGVAPAALAQAQPEVYLPVIVQPMPTHTPTPTFTATLEPTATATNTPEPTPEPTVVQRWLEDGTYVFDDGGLDEGDGAWIMFDVVDSGTRAKGAVFLIDKRRMNSISRLHCYRNGFSFIDDDDIVNGEFEIVDWGYVGRAQPPPTIKCIATSPTSAWCNVWNYPAMDPDFPSCTHAAGRAVKID